MNLVKRWTSSLTTSFDWLINQVENHDALVSAAIREMQAAGVKAKVQVQKVRRDGERMRQRVKELHDVEALWIERAQRVAPESREKALECVRRRRAAQAEREHVESQLLGHAKMEQQLQADLVQIDERVAELRRKKHSMSARQYRAEAMKAGSLGEMGIVAEIDEIFERWEIKIGEYDHACLMTDTLDEECSQAELEAALQVELDEILTRKQ